MLQRLRHYFALGDLQLKLYILATLTGILAGAVIIVFRLLIEQSQVGLLPSGQLDDFASLSWYWILLMPILGGLLVGLLFNGLDAKQRSIVLYTLLNVWLIIKDAFRWLMQYANLSALLLLWQVVTLLDAKVPAYILVPQVAVF
jgi:hypothetical protein